MSNDKTHIGNFIKNIFDDNYAAAKDDLSNAILEKCKDRMQNEMKNASTKDVKGE